MKLADHYTKASLLTSLSVLFVGAVIYFFAINYTVNLQLDKNLSQALLEAEEYAKISGQPAQLYDADQDHAVFTKITPITAPKRYYDTVYRNLREEKLEPGRAVSDVINVGHTTYKVVITASREGNKYLVGVISSITLILIAGLIAALFIINKYVLNGLWKPFYHTLREIKTFNITDVAHLNTGNNKVDEFTELNQAIQEMSGRVKGEYQNLKQFTENASHEMMTPLAIVTAKLDTLIQDETLNVSQLEQINDIYASINRSTRLNQSLLLLIKLDNHLILDEETLNLKVFVLKKIIQFQELIQANNISINTQITDKDITGSKYLFDILLNNLFSNAIRHNLINGEIDISLTNDQLIFKNSGKEQLSNYDKMFERFNKSKESQGTGLGLTLVKNICQYYSFDIHYNYADDRHIFTIDLK
jgi:signal transduction histidine kinase